MLRHVWPRTQAVLRYGLSRGLTVQLNTSGSGQIEIADVVDVCGAELDEFVLHLSLDGIDDQRVDRFHEMVAVERLADLSAPMLTMDDLFELQRLNEEVQASERYRQKALAATRSAQTAVAAAPGQK
jgi:hypothetical protein